MAEKILNTRIQLKIDELSAWESSTIGLKKGEIAIATVSAAAGKELVEPVIMMKVGEDGVKTFSQLPWALHAKASDVYGWAKQSAAQFADSFLAMVGADGTTVQAKLDGIFATDQALTDAVAALEQRITDLSVAALEGRVKALEDYKDTHGDIVTHNAAEFATAEQGAKADAAAVKTEVEAALVLKADKSVVDAMYTNAKIDELLATKQNTIPANTYDAYGSAAAVLGESTDGATANTVYGAKAAAAAAQNDATIAKTKIETFLGTVTPDGSADIIDTLTEINNYVGEHGEEFAALSEKVTKIENGTTATTAGDLTSELEAEIKGYTVANATKAADADKLGGQLPEYYATADSVTNITKENGTIDTKVKAAIDAEVERANSAYATAAQGAKADTALQPAALDAYTKTENLAAIATSGNVNDLVQTTGDVLVFNCGSATEVI